MTDAFELIAKNDLDGLRTALGQEPTLVLDKHASGASLVAWAAYMNNVGAIAAIRALIPELDPHEAIILGDIPRLQAALAIGWDANELSPDGFTPLSLSAFFNNFDAFELLLPATSNVNQQATNPQQVAALHSAAAKRNATMVEKLLRAGADPNLVQSDGVTPLHAAAIHGDTAIVGMLILFGAEPAAKDAKGRDAAAHASAAGHDWLAKQLAQARGQRG